MEEKQGIEPPDDEVCYVMLKQYQEHILTFTEPYQQTGHVITAEFTAKTLTYQLLVYIVLALQFLNGIKPGKIITCTYSKSQQAHSHMNVEAGRLL